MSDTLQQLLTGAGLAFARLATVKTPQQGVVFFRQMGFEFPQAAFGPGLTTLATKAGELPAAVGSLAITTDGLAISVESLKLMNLLREVVQAIGSLKAELQGGAGAVPNLGELPRRLTDFLILDRISARGGGLNEALNLLGLVESESAPAPGQPARLINWQRFGQIFKEPSRIFNDVYGWDTNLDFPKLLARLERYMRSSGMTGGVYPQSDAAVAALGTGSAQPELRLALLHAGLTPQTHSAFGITVSPAPAQGSQKAGFALLPFITGSTSFNFDVCESGELEFASTGDIRGVGIVVRPPFDAKGILNLTGNFDTSIRVHEKKASAEERILIGSAGGTRLSLQGLGVKWYAAGNRDKLDLGVEGEIDALRLVVDAGDGDGFLQKILSGIHVDAQTQLAFGMSLGSGFTFRGGGKLALDLGTHIELGPVQVAGLRFGIEPSAEGITLEAGAILKFALGPMKAVAENIGIRATLHFEPGNLGPVDLGFGFMPPSGVGLSLDTGGFKGGGFLRFEPDKGEYAGALELDFKGLFSVKAIAIINTKMPDGRPGFSLLILITAEFVPIQLSFGFTLNGVGGIFGLNRTIYVDALAEGIRTNAVKSILFPQDVIANITRIISDIKQFFPPEEEHFVVGPMAKLGWGTPSIITVELGLLLDLPRPMFAIVGVLKAVLPSEDAPILRLQVNFIGILDFDRGYVFFRADLYDSRLLLFSITGSMAFLVSWGEEKTFALSVGGFHPDFRNLPTIPALPGAFRDMARIGISLLSDDNPRLKIESYFAITSNTVQFGAKAELYAGVGSFNVYGFLGYDVLFQFDPFHFIAKMYGGIALRWDTDVIASINITAQLSGPAPWDARGTATLTILFFDIDVDFHVTWGDPPLSIESQTEDLLALLRREYADTRNWRADLPPDNHLHVSLRKLEPPKANEPLVIHPAGVLTFSEKALPLDGYLVEKFGTRKPLGDNKFTLSNANANGLAIAADFKGVREQFAPAQFSLLNDEDKLSRRSFEALASGFSLTGTSSIQATLPVEREAEYELSYLKRKPVRTEPRGRVRQSVRAHEMLSRGSAVRQSVLARQQVRVSMNAPPPVVMPAEQYSVANTADLTGYAASGEAALTFSTQAEAYQHQQSLIRRNPALAGQIQVVSDYDLAG